MNNSVPRQIKYYVCLPFRNLTTAQRIIQYLRLGTSLLTVIFVVVLLLFSDDPTTAYVARINCSHIDVAYGLYNSLRNSISATTLSLDMNIDYLPLDSGLTDSEISILTLYTQNMVSDAPQGLLLGVSSWCSINYLTYYEESLSKLHHDNFTTTCFAYTSANMFDYRSLLTNNGLTIILAYAYGSDYDDVAYQKTVAARSKKFNILKIVAIVQLFLQSTVFIATLVVYSSRGPAKDLSRVPSLLLNAVAITSMAAGISMIAAFAVVFQDISATMREVSNGIATFGISMKTGKTFFTVAWLALAFSCLSMISWILPLWCSNPPDEDYFSDDEIYTTHHDTSTLSDRDQFVVRPYQVSRQTNKKKMRKSQSRLFDDVPDHDQEVLLEGESYKEEDTEIQEAQFKLISREHSESELRKLGERMARKLSTRHVSRRKQILEILPEKEDTKNLLYSDTTFANHLYPLELPKVQNGNVTRSGSLSTQVRMLSDPVLRTRNLVDSDHYNTTARKLPNSSNPFRDSLMNDSVSLLDEQEMDYLDNTNVIIKLT